MLVTIELICNYFFQPLSPPLQNVLTSEKQINEEQWVSRKRDNNGAKQLSAITCNNSLCWHKTFLQKAIFKEKKKEKLSDSICHPPKGRWVIQSARKTRGKNAVYDTGRISRNIIYIRSSRKATGLDFNIARSFARRRVGVFGNRVSGTWRIKWNEYLYIPARIRRDLSCERLEDPSASFSRRESVGWKSWRIGQVTLKNPRKPGSSWEIVIVEDQDYCNWSVINPANGTRGQWWHTIFGEGPWHSGCQKTCKSSRQNRFIHLSLSAQKDTDKKK